MALANCFNFQSINDYAQTLGHTWLECKVGNSYGRVWCSLSRCLFVLVAF